MATRANDALLDAVISHQVLLQQFSNREVRELLKLLRKIEPRILRQLDRVRTSWSRARLDGMLSQIRQILAAAHIQMRDRLTTNLRDFSDFEAGFTTQILSAQVPSSIVIASPVLGDLRAAIRSKPFVGRTMAEWFKDLTAAQSRAINQAVRIGWVEGQTNQQMVQAVRGTRARRFRDGVLSTGTRQAEAIVRTAVNTVANRSRQATFEANADIIQGVRWVSTLDGRTSAICRTRDGQVYPIDKGPRPPAHVNCRSSVISVLKSWRGMGLSGLPPGTRASLDGQVPADLSYGEWLRRKPRAFVEQVLGKRKARLFIDGDLEINSFTNRLGAELNLDDLQRLHPDEWARAFS